MFKKGDLFEINIETLAYGGEGIGRLNGITVFVPDSVPGDYLKIEIVSVKKNYARGIIQEIIKPSEYRISPVCSLAKVCGGCQWLHIDYKEQLRAKKKIVEESLKKIANIDIPVHDVISSDCNLEYRCKIQFPVQQTKVSKRILAGYYKKGTHEIVNIKFCPIQPEIINQITQFTREKAQELNLTAYNEKTGKGLIRHLVYRYSQSHKNLLLIVVINSLDISDKLEQLCKSVQDNFKEIAGVLVNFNTSGTNIIMSYKTELACGRDYIEENLEGKKFKISAGSFFQVNPAAAVKIFNEVHKIIKERVENPTILDVYAGVGTFSIWLKDLATKITAIEENSNAVSDVRENIKLNKSENDADIDILEGNADRVLQDLIEQNSNFDVTILDPPRKGCSDVAIDAVARLTNKFIIYVSCNPTTLARDIKLLMKSGFIPEYAQPIDMFCHTYHIESIVVLKRK